jgi:hypothetical protein
MAVTLTTNFAGDVIKQVYKVFGVGNQVIQKNFARLETGIATSRFIPRLTTDTTPMGTYEVTPTGDTAATVYAERELAMVKAMLRVTIDLTAWHAIWEEYRSTGTTLTNLALNPQIFAAVMELYANAVGTQMSDEFWNGTTFIDGIIAKAVADGTVTDVTNIGVITESNVFDVLQDCWDSIPNHLIDDPDFKFAVSTTDWRKMQSANRQLSEAYNGSLSTEVKNLFLTNKIEHFAAIPENTIVGAKASNKDDSNLIFGFFAEPTAELGSPKIVSAAPDSDAMVLRVNFKLDANYAYGGEIILYQGS